MVHSRALLLNPMPCCCASCPRKTYDSACFSRKMSSAFSPKHEHPREERPNPCLSSMLSTPSLSGGTGSDQSIACTISPRRTILRGQGMSLIICMLLPSWHSSLGKPPCTQKICPPTLAAIGSVSKKSFTPSHICRPSSSPKIDVHWCRNEPSLYVLTLPLTSRVSWLPRIIHHLYGFSTFCATMYATTGTLSSPRSTKSPRKRMSPARVCTPAGHSVLRKNCRSVRLPWMSPST
mmetsp:Transcript_33529/g.65404  ORF Transcript_33529/g.65404 Transcript_33529/m.65404 type:complete len:235 (-) Transcript_33529:131-835(-)